MKIFKDVFTGDELFSDTYKIVLKDEVLYEVWGKDVAKYRFGRKGSTRDTIFKVQHGYLSATIWCTSCQIQRFLESANMNHATQYETRRQGEVVLEGSNASAEEADEGTDETSESGIDIVLNHRLVETGFPDKKAFTEYLKGYMKKVVKYLEENNKAGEVDGFKTNIQKVMKELLGRFKDLQFFTGESMDPDAMICMCEYLDVDGSGNERPVLMFFKHGLLEEKF